MTWALAVLLDQLTKIWVRATLYPNESIPLVPGLLNLTFVRNTGAAFGLMPGRRELFMTTSVVVILGVLVFMAFARPHARWLVISLALVAGGAVGNLIDRSLVGRVTDFLEFAFVSFPVWNIADAAIVVGTAMLVVWVLFGPEPGEGALGGVADAASDEARAGAAPHAPAGDEPAEEAAGAGEETP